jgi:hypothetical protein
MGREHRSKKVSFINGSEINTKFSQIEGMKQMMDRRYETGTG